MRALLDEVTAAFRGLRKYKFPIFSLSKGIVSCLYIYYRPGELIV